MPLHVIRRIAMAHCKRGPARCEKCRAADSTKLCLLDVEPPNPGMIQRRVMEVEIGGVKSFREFDVARVFETEEEARRYAAENGIADAEY
ncbi:MAG: hypothetical protein MUC63_10775 [Planctomycetes bacterium]|jgi:hypothetical protein|nr:hypothetical protein [Planctomycetota bacterium]